MSFSHTREVQSLGSLLSSINRQKENTEALFFEINKSQDIIGGHSPSFCYQCKQVMEEHHALSRWVPNYRIPFDRKPHTPVDCMIIENYIHITQYTSISYHTQICHPQPPPKSQLTGQPAHNSPAKIIVAIGGIAPGFSVQDRILASCNNADILDQLHCLLCLAIIHRPLELPCRALVCTDCMVRWFIASNSSGVKCPCCIMDTP